MAAGIRLPRRVVRLAVTVAVSHLMIARVVAGQTDATPPAVAISSPIDGTAVTGTVTATANATDNVGVAGVRFLVDGVPLGTEALTAPYTVDWNTGGSADLVFGVVKVAVGPMTITAGSGLTKRLGVSCPTCSGDDTISVDKIQSAPGATSAAFTFSMPAHYFAHMAAFKAATTPVYRQGAAATSNTGSTTIAKAFASPITAGNLLVVAVAWTGNVALTVTDNRNNVYAVATTAYDAVLGQSLAIVYAANATAGATTVTARFGTSSPKVRRLEIHEYAGMAAANPLDATATNMAAGTTLPDTVTSGSATTTVIAAVTTGSHTLTAVARDSAGNQTTSVPVAITVGDDLTPPVLSSVSASSITAFGAAISWTTNEPATSQVDYGVTPTYGSTSALNATLVTAHTVSLSGLAGSTLYHVRVRSNDAAGNPALSGDLTFTTLDGAAPTVAITGPTGGATLSGSMPITASASDNVGVVGVQFRLDGATLGAEAVTAPYMTSWNTTTAANGSHALTATARDAAGNQTTSAPITVTVNNDTTPPVISAVTSSSVTATGAIITWTTDEPGDSQIDFGQTPAYGSTTSLDTTLVTTHTVPLSGLSDSTLYHVRVRSRDATGNLAVSDDRTITTLDATAPAVSVSAPGSGATVSGMITATATASDNAGVAGVQFRLDGATLGAEAVTAPYTMSWNTTTAANGSHALIATARDAAGNQTTSAPITVVVNNDTTPPVIFSVASSSVTATGAMITWTTDEPGDSQIDFGQTPAYGNTTALDTALVTTHTVSLSGLGDGTLYHVRVRSRDAAGNLAVSGDFTVATLDGTAPTVAITAPTSGATVSASITIAAGASDNAGVAGVQFRLDGATLGAEAVTAPYTTSWDTTTAANGPHTLTAVARDAAGNQATSAPIAVTVNNDTTPPVIFSVASSSVTATGAIITWTTDEPGDSQIDFGQTPAYGNTTALDTALVTTHTVSLSGLSDSTLYHVRVRSRDAAGNLAVSDDRTVTTLDATAPAVSVSAPGSGATVSGTITATATASDNAGVAGVQFVLDGVNLGAEITAAPYSRLWMTAGTTDLIFGVVKVAVGPMTISAGAGVTKRLGVSCPTCTGDDTVTVDGLLSAPGAAAATFTFSAPAHYLAHAAAFKAATTPVYVQGAAATSNAAASTLAQAFTAPVSAGALLVGAVAWSGTAPLTMTDSQGNSYAVAVTAYDAVLNQTLAIVYASNARAGATIVTAGFGALSPAVRRLEIHEYAGMAAGDVLDGTATNSAEGTTAANAISTGAAPTTVTAPVTNGVHTLTAVARDAAGNTATAPPLTVTVFNDATPPTVSLASPAAGTTVMGTITVTANASDNSAVAGVQFQLDGAPLGAEVTTVPYSVSWNTMTAANANHTLSAVARDAAGNIAASSAIAVTVYNDSTPPVISAVAMSSILPLGATIVWTTNEPGDSEVEYGLTTAYGSFSTLDVTLGTVHTMFVGNLLPTALYHFRVRSRDGAGNLGLSGDLSFSTLDGISPLVSLTAPAAGSTVSGTITVTASATDNIGVAGVQFQLDGVPVGAEDALAPYALALDTTAVPPGFHALTAVARDTAGNRTTSASVGVTIANAGQLTLAWDASIDPELSGYKVYVGTSSGVYAVSTIDVGNLTTCTLTGLPPGAVYYIALTAYNQDGTEGGFSGEISATLP